MSLPPGYIPWCQAHGLNAWHPNEWPLAGRQAFQAWKRDLASMRLAQRLADGTWNRLSLDRQAEMLAENAAFAEMPPPSQPFRQCPCHRFGGPGPAADPRPLEDRVSPAQVAAWRAADPVSRAGLTPRSAACLAWLELTFAGREPAS